MKGETKRIARPLPVVRQLASKIVFLPRVQTGADVGQVIVYLLGDLLGRRGLNEWREQCAGILRCGDHQCAAVCSNAVFPCAAVRAGGTQNCERKNTDFTHDGKVAPGGARGRL